MRKVLLILIVPLSLGAQICHNVSSKVHDLFDATGWPVPDVLGKWAYTAPPELETHNDIRRDLLAGQMPAQAAPTQQAVLPRTDQRSWLQRFLLPRNDFAFA